jgi:hypothetical protein
MLSQRIPFLRNLRKQSLIDLLNELTEDHIKIMEEYFSDKVTLSKIDYHIVRNFAFSLNDFDATNLFSNVVISRDDKQIYLTTWR